MQKGRQFKKKNFCAQEDRSGSQNSNKTSSGYGISELILMALEELEDDFWEYEEEEEGEVDLMGELINALDETERLKLKNRKEKETILKYEKEESNSEDIMKLKVVLEEEKNLEDILLQQIKVEKEECEKIEEETACLKKKLEKVQTELNINIQQVEVSKNYGCHIEFLDVSGHKDRDRL